ncbi:FAD-binding domain-containing protein [Penicillium samsonianum]|uniref:FAD-binding domain-containing protein n=1 Tax=Penicillium samsonianum TaxID=1882272 RepID=UPI002548931E|nr:FAD-binding domain-containing protein [Penicillium samsonianum]KAJ6150018.1 FAD-binding domain-containing protein [Penicillium samsonianum]
MSDWDAYGANPNQRKVSCMLSRGGYTQYAGANDIDGNGVTIDSGLLDWTRYNPGTESVEIGPGAIGNICCTGRCGSTGASLPAVAMGTSATGACYSAGLAVHWYT